MPTQLATAVGELTERIVIQTAEPATVSVSTLTRSSQTVTVTTATAHGYADADFVTIAGATQTEYNGEFQIDVTGANTFTYSILSGTPATPATGTITATYVSDGQGGALETWRTLATVWGTMQPLTANETLALGGISAIGMYKARIYYRADVTPKLRVSWRPFGHTTAKLLEIQGVQPDPIDSRRMIVLTLGEVQS